MSVDAVRNFATRPAVVVFNLIGDPARRHGEIRRKVEVLIGFGNLAHECELRV